MLQDRALARAPRPSRLPLPRLHPQGRVKITGVTCHVLLDPGFDRDATSSNQDDIVVEVHTDEGITGIGETDLNAWVARACIEAPGTHTMDLGLAQTLIGMDPLDPVAVWDKLYVGTAMTGRRGAVVGGAAGEAPVPERAHRADWRLAQVCTPRPQSFTKPSESA